MKVGVFGGTFDPPHLGHLIVAQDAADALALDRVLFVPAARPPHKRDDVLSPAAVRHAMTLAATAGHPAFRVDDRELRRAGPSYTVDTLEALVAEAPADEHVLLMGADQYAAFDTWRSVERIRALCRVAVLDREGGAAAAAPDRRVRVTRIDISASGIRARVRAGRSIRYLVPEGVASLIRDHGLYRADGAGVERQDRNGAASPG